MEKGSSHTEETKKKMRESHADISGEKNPFYGKKHTKETRLKMSKAGKGRIVSEKSKRKISESQKGKIVSKEARRKMSESTKGYKNSQWKGGRLFDSRRRILIWQPSHPYSNGKGYVFEHRLVAEKVLGRHLGKNEVVHHVNGNIQDNRNANLMICETGYHHSLHRKMEKIRRNQNERI